MQTTLWSSPHQDDSHIFWQVRGPKQSQMDKYVWHGVASAGATI